MDQLVDVQRLLVRCDQRQKLAKKLVQSFAASIEEYQEALLKAYQAKDLAGLARLAHRLKGAASLVSADQLALLATKVERSVSADPEQPLELRESMDDLLLHLLDWGFRSDELDGLVS